MTELTVVVRDMSPISPPHFVVGILLHCQMSDPKITSNNSNNNYVHDYGTQNHFVV